MSIGFSLSLALMSGIVNINEPFRPMKSLIKTLMGLIICVDQLPPNGFTLTVGTNYQKQVIPEVLTVFTVEYIWSSTTFRAASSCFPGAMTGAICARIFCSGISYRTSSKQRVVSRGGATMEVVMLGIVHELQWYYKLIALVIKQLSQLGSTTLHLLKYV